MMREFFRFLFSKDFARLLTGRIAFERRARLLAAELGVQWATERRRTGYAGIDAFDEVEKFYFFFMEGMTLDRVRAIEEMERRERGDTGVVGIAA